MLRSFEVFRDGRSSRGWLLAAAAWAVLIFVLSSIPTDGSTGGITLRGSLLHVAEYAVLATLLGLGGVAWRATVLAAVLYGLTDELHQAVVPGRDAALTDVAFDLVGAMLGVLVGTVLSRR